MNGYQVLLLLLGTVSAAVNNSRYFYEILPTSTYINVNGSFFTQASPQACYADCQSCQIQTLVCEECFAPYYVKTSQGTCQFSSNYTMQSSSNEARSGAGFFIAGESWTNFKVVNCSALNINPEFTANLVAIQPINSSQVIQYNRTLSIHNYLVITFLLITSEWNNASSITFSFYNQAGTKIIEDIRQTFLPNVPKQSLCNPNPVDQRFAIDLRIQDNNSTSISIAMVSESGAFSVATWAVLSGLCDSTCSSCSYSTDPKACLGCNYFLRQVADGSCSQCPAGFKLSNNNNNNFTFCQKCPIQYQFCSETQTTCYYSELNATTKNNCSLVYDGSFYDEMYEINEQIFAGSLFTVGGLPSPSLYAACGNQPLSSYTYVGQAQTFQPITRIFATLRQHIALSISFNVFVVDMVSASQDMKFQIYINNNLYDVQYLTIVGMSNLCGGSGLQSFMTFPPTQFYENSQTQNVNLTIVANGQWGIRNLRLAFQVCDQTCLTCGEDSCIECKGILQLKNGVCSDCPFGFGKNISAVSLDQQCVSCPQNCLNCTVENKTVTCLLCSNPFFLFEGSCQKKANIGDSFSATNLTGSSNQTCTVNVPSASVNAQPTSFSLSQSVITTSVRIDQPHYKFIVQFYVMRVGLWSPNDRLQVYFNDLLMLTKKYSDYGNKICNKNSNTNQTDYMSFQSIEYTDYNNSLTLSFQLVTVNGTNRTFGVSNIKVYPVGCESCLSYPFSYRIQYSYDSALNVVVSFSRIYKNTNATLFKQIFQLILNGKRLPYEITSNNSVSYNLKAFPSQDTIMGNLSLQCHFPQLVVTDITDPINTQPFFSRLLAANYTTSKPIDNEKSDTAITRFTPVQQLDAISGVRTFFQIVSRTVIYVGFAFFFFGLQTICTHFMHNLQKIWLHIFLASLTAPGLLRYALSGFKQVQNQNIAVNPTSWQKGLPLELYYNSPVYLYSYTTDVNFFRNIYNIGVAFAVFLIFLLIMHFLTKKFISRQMTMDNMFWRHLKVTYHRRPFFYFNSIVFYQYLTLMLACFLQFTSLNNQTDQGSFSGVTAAAAIIAFVLGTIYPIFHFLWLRHKQNTIGRDKSIEYANRYHQIFFRFVHKNIWEGSEITYVQRFYNIYRFGELWWFTLVATALNYNPQAQLYLMIVTFSLHMFLLLFTGISRNLFFKAMKSLELALFVGLEIIMLVCQTDNATLTTRSYNTLGNVAIALIFCIIFCSLIRSIYNGWLIYREYSYLRLGQQVKSRMRQGEVMRRDEHFKSQNGDQNVEIQIASTDRQ